MASAEFQHRLQEARAYRQEEFEHLIKGRNTGLGDEAVEYDGLLRDDPRYRQARHLVMLNRWREMGEKLPDYTPEQWEEVGKVFSGINNGMKAALFSYIAVNTSPGDYMKVDNVVEGFKEMFAGSELAEALVKRGRTKSSVVQYCSESLCDVGLLAEEVKQDDWGKEVLEGFTVTDTGRKLGIPAALSVLWYENQEKGSIHPIFGKTGATKGRDRAPENRAKILDYMVRQVYEVRDTDIEKNLHIDLGVVGTNTDSLDANGLIAKVSVETHTGNTQIRYGLIEGKNPSQAKHLTRKTTLQKRIVELLPHMNGPVSAQEVLDLLPDELKQKTNNSYLRKSINQILSFLEGQKYLSRVNGFRGGEKFSDITLTQKGRRIYFEVMDPVLRASQGRALSETQQAHMQDTQNHFAEYARSSVEYYYPHSASYKWRESEKNRESVFDLIAGNPDKSWTVQKLTGEIGLSTNTMLRYLTPNIPDSNEISYTSADGKTKKIRREMENGV